VICLVAFLPIGLKFQLCELLSQSHYHVLFLTQLLFLLIFVNIVGAFVWRLTSITSRRMRWILEATTQHQDRKLETNQTPNKSANNIYKNKKK
jgi:hypothetical protein